MKIGYFTMFKMPDNLLLLYGMPFVIITFTGEITVRVFKRVEGVGKMFDYFSYAKEIRRELHQFPEIGFDLPKTLAVVRRELDKMGIPYTEKYGKSSIVATINAGKPFTVALRGDMDALPIKEETGLEFASGIPGSLGGAVFMNAGAYDHDMSEVLEKVISISPSGEVLTWKKEDLALGYRSSVFMIKGGIVAEAVLKLRRGNIDEIQAQIRTYTEKRTKSQPLNFPSAGSMFKRPTGYYTGALIEQAGLKGFSIGGAQVSEKHAGFVINTGNATAADIDALVSHIQATIREKNGVELTREVRFIGRGFN